MKARTDEGTGETRARWDAFWFGEASLVRLAVFRIVMLAAAFDGVWTVRKAVFQFAEARDPAFVKRDWNPIYVFELLGLGAPGPLAARLLWAVLLVAIALGILGLCTRLACAVVALVAFYWIGIEYSIGKPHHTCVALIFGLFALPFAPVGARLSLSSLRRRLQVARAGGDPCAVPDAAPWAAFPLRLTQITIALGYFFAGATKLAKSGPAWANGYTLQGIMVEYASSWSSALSAHHGLLVSMSIGLLAVQICFPLVFLGAWARWLFLPLAVLFHLMAMQTMATGPFLSLWLTLSAFVALERVHAFLERNAGTGAPWRRMTVGALFAAGVVGTVALYLDKKPAWLALPLIPVGFGGLLVCLPGLLAPLSCTYDAGNERARALAAWIAACDWGRRVTLLAGAGPGIVVHDARGLELRGNARALAVLVRLPPAICAAPFLWRDLRGAVERPGQGGTT